MTPKPAARLRLAQAAAAAAALAGLSACAGTQTSSSAAPPAAAVAAPPPIVTMAPIANPESATPARREPTTISHSRSVEPTPGRHVAPGRPVPAGGVAPAPAPTADPAAAARLRARGLEELNRGAVAKAVALLSQASRLDPGSAVIRRDLERAERIDRAVHTPR